MQRITVECQPPLCEDLTLPDDQLVTDATELWMFANTMKIPFEPK